MLHFYSSWKSRTWHSKKWLQLHQTSIISMKSAAAFKNEIAALHLVNSRLSCRYLQKAIQVCRFRQLLQWHNQNHCVHWPCWSQFLLSCKLWWIQRTVKSTFSKTLNTLNVLSCQRKRGTISCASVTATLIIYPHKVSVLMTDQVHENVEMKTAFKNEVFLSGPGILVPFCVLGTF